MPTRVKPISIQPMGGSTPKIHSIATISTQTTCFEVQHQPERVSSEYGGEDVERELLNGVQITSTKFAQCISIRLFIIILITSLLLICSALIWVTGFVGSQQALNTMSNELLLTYGESVIRYMDGQIRPYIAVTHSVADDYNIGLIPRSPPLSYLYKKYSTFKPYGIGLVFDDEV